MTSVKTTNYFDTFIEVAEDCPVKVSEIPPTKSEKTVANLEYEMLVGQPYRFTSDDVLFYVFAVKKNIAKDSLASERMKFFSKGQPCFRSSPLTKRYGWGVHSNAEGKIAIFAMESKEYNDFLKDKDIKHLKAMRSTRG